MSDQANKNNQNVTNQSAKPGEGIRSMRSTMLFRTINFELYAKPVSEIFISQNF